MRCRVEWIFRGVVKCVYFVVRVTGGTLRFSVVGGYFEVSCSGGILRGLVEVSCSWDILRCSPDDHSGYLEMYYCN